MSKTFKGGVTFTNNFDVKVTKPLDIRLVVDSYEDLTNGSIEAPYQGMVVNIKGTSQLWILKTESIEDSHNRANWELVTGSGSGSGLSRYSLPVMTPEMVEEASNDYTIDFDGSEDTHILIGDELNPTEEQGDVYMGLIRDMAGAIRALQAEVARLKNSFDYGIDSYTDTRTAKSVQLGSMTVDEDEPLWAIDPGYLSLVPDTAVFNTTLDFNHTFIPIGDVTIDTSVEGQLTFNNGGGKFYDGKRVSEDGQELQFEDYTLYKLNDSKLITYLVTNKPDITMTLVSLTNRNQKKVVNFAPLLNGNTVNKYGFCVVISRKDKDTGKGFNYIYFSIINYENDQKLCEGYLNEYNRLSDTRVELGDGERYSIESIEFDRLTLSRIKFYTKFEDFSEEVISSAPSESDYKYEVAHIAIRSVKNTEILNTVADHLRDNELIWNKGSKTLHIKSDGKVYTIGSKSTNPDDDNNNDNNMTDKEIVNALKKMGIIVNVEYNENTDEIISLSNVSLAPISDITFINEDTEKKFTFSVDPEGNLVGKDKSTQTIEEYMNSLGDSAGKYDLSQWENGYTAFRGFSSDYLFRKNGVYQISTTAGVNQTTDAGKQSDRLRISSFYAPITTDDKHGCTHSFIELENSSPVDIPLTGVYLHFYNPTENNYQGGVHHLALDGVIKAGGTYLIRGAKHAEFDDESAFIKVKTFDKEWYENKSLISFEQEPVITKKEGSTEIIDTENNRVNYAYRFCLTYGLPELSPSEKLVEAWDGDSVYAKADFPNKILNPRFIDSCSYSTFDDISKKMGDDDPWYIGNGIGITIKPNSMFRLMFALDPAKQAFNGFNKKDSSRIRYNSANDIQILNLDKEFIGFPNSNEVIKIDRYTPRASFENRNVMTDKSQLNREKPNMVTCSFGVDVYNTRCFNWISCGTFDESVWIRKEGETSWNKFDSYKKVSYTNETLTVDNFTTTTTNEPIRKEYSPLVNNTVYARMINRFPGNDVLFTAHKCVIILPDATTTPVKYEYVVGRPDKDGNPDFEHTNEIYTFTVYPRTYEGRLYQITDQQGFHWIEYQVWAASAEFLNNKIDDECFGTNKVADNIFPILLNTGDMTQSGARINEWLDYYNGGISLFNHLEQMNCVGNNDLCPINPRELGTGNDNDKSSSHFFHYFYCFDVKDTDKYVSASENEKKFFSGESLIVRAHSGSVPGTNSTTYIDVLEDKYIPSQYYFKTKNMLYIIVNSEIPITNCQNWFGLCSSYSDSSKNKYVNIYTGIEVATDGNYAGVSYFTPIYETMYAWLDTNDTDNDVNIKKVVVAMHEMPFTVITRASLTNKNSAFLPATRNHPNGKDARVGSNVNQLTRAENRGICWCSRLLEYFNCKLVIGGHKHTYALSYPIKEKYSWTYNNVTKDSKDEMKPMFETLADEAGTNPTYNISWYIDLSDSDVQTAYNIGDVDTSTVKLNSSKTPYVPETLYNSCGASAFEAGKAGLIRCCTPLDTTGNDKYDGFVTYSMCQATGYKLKSNKELPWSTQVFSKIIPKTDKKNDTDDKPNKNQLYPMYSVLELEYDANDKVSGINVSMNRITGVFADNGSDVFNQLSFGTGSMGVQQLCTGSDVEAATRMYGKWVSETAMSSRDIDERYLHIKF